MSRKLIINMMTKLNARNLNSLSERPVFFFFDADKLRGPSVNRHGVHAVSSEL
jgi:hypothetical protein